MTAARLVVWRHGRTQWNVDRRFQGQADIGLDDVGRAEAAQAANVLATLQPSALYSSDLDRTRQTAAALARLSGLDVISDPRLREIHVGSWEGLLAEEVAEADPECWERLRRGEDVRRSSTGESVAEVGERVAAALTDIADAAVDDATVVVTSHGLAARAGICRLIGLPPEHWRVLGSLDNCAWAVLEWHRGGHYYRIAGYDVAASPVAVAPIS